MRKHHLPSKAKCSHHNLLASFTWYHHMETHWSLIYEVIRLVCVQMWHYTCPRQPIFLWKMTLSGKLCWVVLPFCCVVVLPCLSVVLCCLLKWFLYIIIHVWKAESYGLKMVCHRIKNGKLSHKILALTSTTFCLIHASRSHVMKRQRVECCLY